MADKITLGNIASFQNDATAIAQYNANNALLTTAINNTLSRDGTSPNQIGSPVDMNSQPILNLPAPSTLDSPLRLADLNSTISIIPTFGIPCDIRFVLKNINLNSASTDNTLALSLPAGFTRWSIFRALVTNASSSLTTATIGVFTGAGGTGQTIIANQALSSITQSAPNVNGNLALLTATNPNTEAYSVTSLFVRVGTAQGSAATADLVFQIFPLT